MISRAPSRWSSRRTGGTTTRGTTTRWEGTGCGESDDGSPRRLVLRRGDGVWVHRVVHAARGGGERGQIVLAMTLMDDLASAPRNAGGTAGAVGAGCRQRWRALPLIVRAKVELVAAARVARTVPPAWRPEAILRGPSSNSGGVGTWSYTSDCGDGRLRIGSLPFLREDVPCLRTEFAWMQARRWKMADFRSKSAILLKGSVQ